MRLRVCLICYICLCNCVSEWVSGFVNTCACVCVWLSVSVRVRVGVRARVCKTEKKPLLPWNVSSLVTPLPLPILSIISLILFLLYSPHYPFFFPQLPPCFKNSLFPNMFALQKEKIHIFSDCPAATLLICLPDCPCHSRLLDRRSAAFCFGICLLIYKLV